MQIKKKIPYVFSWCIMSIHQILGPMLDTRWLNFFLRNSLICTSGQFPYCRKGNLPGKQEEGLKFQTLCQALRGKRLPERPESFPFAQKGLPSEKTFLIIHVSITYRPPGLEGQALCSLVWSSVTNIKWKC